MILRIIALTTVLLLAACGTGISSNAGLTVIEYSPEAQVQAANEMEGGQCPMLNNFINDYSVLRDQARVE